MIISVTQRTREIGIMRSLGALRSEILSMFLYEALVLGLAGSLVGGLLSIGVGYAISGLVAETIFAGFGTTPAGIDPAGLRAILLGISFGIGTSVLSGIYPAWKAAHLDPIDALRYE